MLQRLLQVCISPAENEQVGSVDLQDRAKLYYALMQEDMSLAQRVVCTHTPITTFTEERDLDRRRRLFEEFDSLAVLYGKPSEEFVKEGYRRPLVVHRGEPQEDEGEYHQELHHEEDVEETADLLGHMGVYNVTSPRLPPFSLSMTNPMITPPDFQASWTQWEERHKTKLQADMSFDLLGGGNSKDAGFIEKTFEAHGIFCLASGQVGTQLKFYFFSKDAQDRMYLSEVLLDSGTGEVEAVTKAASQEGVGEYAVVLQSAVEMI